MSRKEAGSYCVTELGQTGIIFPRAEPGTVQGQNFQLENSLVWSCRVLSQTNILVLGCDTSCDNVHSVWVGEPGS